MVEPVRHRSLMIRNPEYVGRVAAEVAGFLDPKSNELNEKYRAIRRPEDPETYEEYIARGALCRGRLYHDPKMVFGDALVNAHTLESQVARYPCIMLTKDVVINRYKSI